MPESGGVKTESLEGEVPFGGEPYLEVYDL